VVKVPVAGILDKVKEMAAEEWKLCTP